MSGSPNFLALRSASGDYYLNGNWYIQWSGDYDVAGASGQYSRRHNRETFKMKGPITEDLHVLVSVFFLSFLSTFFTFLHYFLPSFLFLISFVQSFLLFFLSSLLPCLFIVTTQGLLQNKILVEQMLVQTMVNTL